MSEEIWKAIPGYEGSYEVSDQGRVRSLDRVVEYCDGRLCRFPGRLLALNLNPGGYLQVGLCVSGKRTTRSVHCLVLEAFVGPCPEGCETGHRDGNRTNNCLRNLRYITHSQNSHEIAIHGRRKFSCDQIREIRTRVAAGEPYPPLAKEFDSSTALICLIANRKRYASVPDHA